MPTWYLIIKSRKAWEGSGEMIIRITSEQLIGGAIQKKVRPDLIDSSPLNSRLTVSASLPKT